MESLEHFEEYADEFYMPVHGRRQIDVDHVGIDHDVVYCGPKTKEFTCCDTAIILIVAPLYVAPPQIRGKSLMLGYFICGSPYPEQVVNHSIRKQILNKLNVLCII